MNTGLKLPLRAKPDPSVTRSFRSRAPLYCFTFIAEVTEVYGPKSVL